MPRSYVNFRKRSGGGQSGQKQQRTGRSTYSRNKFRSMVRKEVLRTTETKMKTQQLSSSNLYHNTWNVQGWLMNLQLGEGKDNRTGDEVYLKSIVTKIHINSKPDRQASMIRALLVRVPAADATAPADLFEGGSNGIINFVNTSECAILAQKMVRMQGDTVWRQGGSGVTTVQKDLNQCMTLSYNFKNAKTKYDGQYPKYWTVRLLVLAYDAHGTLTTDNIADYMCVSRLYFKDP